MAVVPTRVKRFLGLDLCMRKPTKRQLFLSSLVALGVSALGVGVGYHLTNAFDDALATYADGVTSFETSYFSLVPSDGGYVSTVDMNVFIDNSQYVVGITTGSLSGADMYYYDEDSGFELDVLVNVSITLNYDGSYHLYGVKSDYSSSTVSYISESLFYYEGSYDTWCLYLPFDSYTLKLDKPSSTSDTFSVSSVTFYEETTYVATIVPTVYYENDDGIYHGKVYTDGVNTYGDVKVKGYFMFDYPDGVTLDLARRSGESSWATVNNALSDVNGWTLVNVDLHLENVGNPALSLSERLSAMRIAVTAYDTDYRFQWYEGASTYLPFSLDTPSYSYWNGSSWQVDAPMNIGGGSIVTNVAEWLTAGISELGSGIGQGVSSFVGSLAVQDGALSPYFVLVCVFGGIALAVGLTTKVFNWLSVLGA